MNSSQTSQPLRARISKPSRTAMQSGRGRTDQWVLEYETLSPRRPENLMGWTSSGDTLNQVKLKFNTLEEAVSFAEEKGLAYTVLPDQERVVRPRNYVDNFKYIPPEANQEKSEEKSV
jgi:hypothetical protein